MTKLPYENLVSMRTIILENVDAALATFGDIKDRYFDGEDFEAANVTIEYLQSIREGLSSNIDVLVEHAKDLNINSLAQLRERDAKIEYLEGRVADLGLRVVELEHGGDDVPRAELFSLQAGNDNVRLSAPKKVLRYLAGIGIAATVGGAAAGMLHFVHLF